LNFFAAVERPYQRSVHTMYRNLRFFTVCYGSRIKNMAERGNEELEGAR
jgi:hypothetical protein